MNLPLALTLLFLGLAAPVSFAQSQSEMNQEAVASFEKADQELNKLYLKVMADLDAEGKAKLKAAQRAWVAFRDAEADFQADSEARGGSLAPLIYAGTRARLTKARIAEFRESIKNSANR